MYGEDFLRSLDRLYQAGELDAAEAALRRELETASGDARISLLNELGGFYRGISRYEQSASAFQEALRLLEDGGQVGGSAYATVLLNLAGVFRLAGRQDRAERLLCRALSMLSPDNDAYVAVLNGLSLVRREQGRLEDAARLGEAALAWFARRGGYARETATAQVNQASLLLAQGDLDGAARMLDQALEYFEKQPEPDAHYAAALSAKGAVCFRRGDWGGAERAYRSAQSLTEHFFGRNSEYEAARAALEAVCRARRSGQ